MSQREGEHFRAHHLAPRRRHVALHLICVGEGAEVGPPRSIRMGDTSLVHPLVPSVQGRKAKRAIREDGTFLARLVYRQIELWPSIRKKTRSASTGMSRTQAVQCCTSIHALFIRCSLHGMLKDAGHRDYIFSSSRRD